MRIKPNVDVGTKDTETLVWACETNGQVQSPDDQQKHWQHYYRVYKTCVKYTAKCHRQEVLRRNCPCSPSLSTYWWSCIGQWRRYNNQLLQA